MNQRLHPPAGVACQVIDDGHVPHELDNSHCAAERNQEDGGWGLVKSIVFSGVPSKILRTAEKGADYNFDNFSENI